MPHDLTPFPFPADGPFTVAVEVAGRREPAASLHVPGLSPAPYDPRTLVFGAAQRDFEAAHALVIALEALACEARAALDTLEAARRWGANEAYRAYAQVCRRAQPTQRSQRSRSAR